MLNYKIPSWCLHLIAIECLCFSAYYIHTGDILMSFLCLLPIIPFLFWTHEVYDLGDKS